MPGAPPIVPVHPFVGAGTSRQADPPPETTMQPAPIPADESFRQLTLDELSLDQPSQDPELDAIVSLAARITCTPMAAFTVISRDRQRYQSRVGIDSEETPRATSFCGHVVAQDLPLLVTDTRADERFHDNPMVAGEQGVRAYLGLPVRAPSGFSVGALCVLDHQPREFSDEDRERLQTLARLVETQLVLRSVRYHDALTGLYNHAGFNFVMEKAWRRARGIGEAHGLLLMSLDRYLSYGGGEGTEAKQALLTRIGQLMRERYADRKGVVCGRLHDDRFALYASGEASLRLDDEATGLREAIGGLQGLLRPMTASLGYAQVPSGERPDRSTLDLMERAVVALRFAKQSGGNRCRGA